jgi:hypothetical protein
MISPPAPGDPAPRCTCQACRDGRLDLTRLCGQPVLVSFLRHAG